eukprot:TRINITY_DN307_c0_g1_i3.p1 TRINITY_DN307_c0_g1~~TRINITY_DN307_c0_g1_i3.p1  ORF type:complete len:170 (+),score=29.77 TRINITY_DN307_c0_g1_i3:156-665(+)
MDFLKGMVASLTRLSFNPEPQTFFEPGRPILDGTFFFDDELLIPDLAKLPHKVSKMTVWSNNIYVFGIEIFYLTPDGEVSSGEHQGSQSIRVRPKTITFEADEFITKISGNKGHWFDRLEFHTNRQRKFEFGGRGGTPFSLEAPECTQFSLSFKAIPIAFPYEDKPLAL